MRCSPSKLSSQQLLCLWEFSSVNSGQHKLVLLLAGTFPLPATPGPARIPLSFPSPCRTRRFSHPGHAGHTWQHRVLVGIIRPGSAGRSPGRHRESCSGIKTNFVHLMAAWGHKAAHFRERTLSCTTRNHLPVPCCRQPAASSPHPASHREAPCFPGALLSLLMQESSGMSRGRAGSSPNQPQPCTRNQGAGAVQPPVRITSPGAPVGSGGLRGEVKSLT